MMNRETIAPVRTSSSNNPQYQTSPGVFAMLRLRTALAAASLAFASVCAVPFATAQSTKAAPQLLPYTVTAVAGGSTTSPAAGSVCATGSSLVSTDAYGDGCLATQVALGTAATTKGLKEGPQYVTADGRGNVFFSDTFNGLVRRIDGRTGIITTVAGGASNSPAAGAACGTFTSADILGNGCLATSVKLANPEGLAISPLTGEIFFADSGNDTVRKVTAAGNIVLIAGSNTNTYGYAVNSAAGSVNAASGAGYLNFPYGIAFTPAGNLIIADEGNNAIEAVNLTAGPATIAGVSIPAGTIAKLMGFGDKTAKTSGADCPQFASTTARGGCYFGKYSEGAVALTAQTDSPYDVSVDVAGNIYFANEFLTSVAEIRTDGTVVTAAGVFNGKPSGASRGPESTTNLGSDYGVNVDSFGNIYISDSSAGFIWRVDSANQGAYVLAGGATTVCATATDTVGDGCAPLQAKFSTLAATSTSFATTPGVQGLYADHSGNLYAADSVNLLIRKLSTGAQFPALASGKSLTQNLQIHFGAGDTQSTYTLPVAGSSFGAIDFTLGTAACTTNSDTTQDCVLPVTFTPTAAGIRTAPLVVKSTSGLSSSFALTGTGNAALLLTDAATNTTSATTLGSGPFPAVAALAGDTAGNLYAAVPTATGIRKIAQGAATTIGTATNAVAVTTDPAGNVYAALSSGSIVLIPASGAPQTTLGSGFTAPSGLAADIFGNVFVADSSANTVTRIAAGTLVQTVLATAQTGISGPTGLAVDFNGNVFVANTVANNVVEIPFSGAPNLTLGSGLSAPRAVATGAAGALYIADTRNARIVYIPNENGTLTTADQLTIASAGLTTPSGVVVTASGILYVADSTANAIYSYNRSAATQAFGNDAIGTQVTAAADLISAGNLPVTFSTPYFAATGNTGDFSLTPSALSAGTTLAPGFGVALTAGFKPTANGARQAVYTFSTTNVPAPTLTLTGTGITPVNATTTTIAAMPTSGTYGQTVTVNLTVAVPAGQPAATGVVTVKVDTTTYTPTLSATGTASLPLTGLSAGSHTITASYAGDATSSPSTATPVTVTLAPAPLTVTANSATRQYLAANPTLTGTLTGVVNNDTIGVTYSTTATQASPVGTYPITATVSGTAAANYTVTSTPGVLTITKAGTTTLLSTSSTAVASTTAVTLTATVTPTTSGTPTGSVSFYNGTTLLATVALANGTAATTTTFPVGTSTVTAVYTGDSSYTTSTSTAVNVVSSTAGFNVSGAPATASVVQGQTALLSFTVTPTFGYAGTITASCSNLPATVGCIFSPSSITSTGSNTASLIAMSLTTVQPGGLVQNTVPSLTPRSTIAFALLPGLALLAGFATRRRKALHTLRGLLLLVFAFAAITGLSGCGQGHFATPTPTGTYNVNVTLTGTPATTGGANLTSSFNVALNVTTK